MESICKNGKPKPSNFASDLVRKHAIILKQCLKKQWKTTEQKRFVVSLLLIEEQNLVFRGKGCLDKCLQT